MENSLLSKGKKTSVEIILYIIHSLRDNMRTESIMQDFQNEFQMMREFDHKNIVKLRGVSMPSARIVMEYIEKGSLFHWLGSNNRQVRRRSQTKTSRFQGQANFW